MKRPRFALTSATLLASCARAAQAPAARRSARTTLHVGTMPAGLALTDPGELTFALEYVAHPDLVTPAEAV